jgi:hypothetical protein
VLLNTLFLRERAGVRGFKQVTALMFYPLILFFSLRRLSQ